MPDWETLTVSTDGGPPTLEEYRRLAEVGKEPRTLGDGPAVRTGRVASGADMDWPNDFGPSPYAKRKV